MEKLRTYPPRMWILLACLLFSLQSQAQSSGILAAEYFFDQDPGIGMGVAIPITPGLDSLEVNGLNVPVAGLAAGYHYLQVRVFEAHRGWSIAAEQLFYINPLLSPINPPLPPFTLSEAEYFFNTDPGPGLANALPFVAGDSTAILRTLEVAGLAPGIHRVGIRFRELSGMWSTVQFAEFTVTDTAGLFVPQADFSWDTTAALAGQQVAFTNQSSNTDINTLYEWDIEADGIVDYTTPNINHNFAGPGIYDVLLRVTNPEGNLDTAALRALYRFYDGSLLANAGSLGLLTAIGNPAFVTDRTGTPGAAFSTDTSSVLTYLTSGASNLSLDGFTISYWFKGNVHNNSLYLRTPYGDVISGQSNRHYVGSANLFVDNANGNAVKNGQWNHIAFSWQPNATNGFKAYLNGMRVGQTNSHAINNPTLDSLVLGAVGGSQARGTYDDLFIFGRVLDSSEIVNLYNEAITTTIVKQVLVGPVPSNELQVSGVLRFCAGDSVLLTAPTGSNHLWSTGQSGISITVSQSGTYSCAYVDVNGNGRVTNKAEVQVDPVVEVDLLVRHATNGQANGSVVSRVSGGSAFRYQYSWSTGDTTPMIANLVAGSYQLTVDDGRCPRQFTVVVADSLIQPLTGIVAAEAFFNSDPGVGAGIPLVVQQGAVSLNVANLSVGSLPAGFHTLSFRVLDQFGTWSNAQSFRFSVVPAVDSSLIEPKGDLIYAEYFFDEDPGVGNGMALGFVTTADLNAPFQIPVNSSIGTGFHQLSIRVKDSNGRWSISQERTIFIDVPPPAGGPNFRLPMIAAEYFFGETDPGIGLAQALSIPTADSIFVLRDLPVDSLPIGQNRINIRTMDVMGNWSQTRSSMFTVGETACTTAQPDFEPISASAAVPVQLQSTSTGTNASTSYSWDIGADGSIDYTGSTASHTFANPGIYDVRLILNAGDSCQVAVVKHIVVGPMAQPIISANGPLVFCEGESVQLSAPAGSGYIWSTADTTASIVVAASGNYIVTYNDPAGVRRQAAAVHVRVNPSLQIVSQSSNPNNGLSNGSAGVQVRGGSAFRYQYSWNTGETTPSISGLAPGSYQVTVTDGLCPQTIQFQLIDTVINPLVGVVAAEYFFNDNDPGTGLATPLVIRQGPVSQGFVNVPTGSLARGPHRLSIRVRDDQGQWSIASVRTISVFDTFPTTQTQPPAPIIAAEYFYDEDPGVGNGTAIQGIVPTQLLDIPVQASTAGLQPGVHNLFIRTLDSLGHWSFVARSQVFIDLPIPPGSPNYRIPMVYAEYYLGDEDPGVGNATPITVPSDTLWQLQRSIDLAGLLPGNYVLNLRTRDVQGLWSTIQRHPFNIAPANCIVPRPSFSYPLVNAGQAATFINTSTNIEPTSSYSWDFGANGTVDDTTAAPSFAFSSPGTHDVKLTISNGANCVVSVVQQVVVGPVLANQLVLDGPTTLCAPEVRTLTAPAGSNYIWSSGDTTRSIQANRSGRYEVAYIDVQGNRRFAPAVQLQVNAAMQVQLAVLNATNGNMNGSAGVSVSGGNAFRYSYLWSTGDSVASISNLGPGQYFVQVSDGFCPQTIFFSVSDSVIPAPVGLVAAEYFFDQDPGPGAATLFTISQGQQGGGFGGVSLVGLNPGLHLLGIRVLESTGLWSHAKTYQIFISEDDPTVPEPIGLLASAEYFIDADPGPYLGTPLAVPTGVSLYDLPLNIPVGNISPGNHTLSIRVFDSNGKWSIAASAEFNNCNPPAKPVAIPDMVLCTGDSIRLGIVQRDSGQVVWTGPNGFSSNDTAPVIAMAGLANSGYYLLQIEGEPGCFSIADSVLVQVDTIPANPGAIIGPATVCLGSNIANFTIPPVLTARNYVWQLPAGALILAGNNTNSIAVDLTNWNDTVGTISVIASNGCGSVQSSPIVIRRDSTDFAVNVVALADTSVCAGQTVLLEASALPAGFTIQWRRNGQLIAGVNSQQLIAHVTGNYQAELLNSAGCGRLSNSVAVSINPLPTALVSVAGAASICGSGTVQLTAQAVGGASYQWLRDGNVIVGATNRVFQASSAGSYELVVTTAAGCSDTSAAIPLSIYPIPVASITAAGPTSFCAGGSVVLHADSGAGLAYQWLKGGLLVAGANQASLVAEVSGSYRVLVTNAGACFDTSAAVQVQVQPLPVASISLLGTDSICEGSSAVFEAAFVSGASYQWMRNGQLLAQVVGRQLSAVLAGDYQVVVTSAFGCVDTSSALPLFVKPLPDVTVQASGLLDFCLGGSVELQAVALSGYQYQWLKDGQPLPGSTSSQLLVQVSGQYAVIVTGENACSDTSLVVPVTVNPLPDVTLNLSGSQFVCAGGSLNLSVPLVAGNSYQWLLNGQPLSGAQGATLVAQQAGIYRVVVTRVATACVDTSVDVSLGIYPQPQAGLTAGGATSFCSGGSVLLNAAPATGVTYTWLKDGLVQTTAASSSFTASASGSYRVVVTNSDGCSDTSAAVSVTVFPQPQAGLTAGGATSFCAGGSVLLNAAPATGVSYVWLKDGAVQTATSGSSTASASGSYRVVVTNSDGCSDTSAAVSVTVLPQPQAGLTAGGATSFCAGGSVLLNAAPASGVTYTWLKDGLVQTAASSSFTASASGSYRVVVTNSDGCSDTSAAVSVTVFPQPQASLTAGGPTSFCAGGNVLLNAAPASGVTYTWLKDGALITGASLSNFSANQSGNYQVIVTTANGCSDTSSSVTVTVQVCGYIAGSVNYLNQANTPMTNTQVMLLNQQQQTIGQTTTNANGGFSFSNTGNGQFQLQLSTNKPWGGVNATDALAAARHFTGLAPQTGLRLQAADVNASNNVNATDALQIGRRFTGQLGSFAAGNWAFDAPSIVVNNDTVQLQLGALAYGDINGSYLPDVQLRMGNEVLLAKHGFAEAQQQRWPIQAAQAFEAGAISLVLNLPAGIEVLGVQIPASSTTAEFSQQGQELRISWFSLQPMSLQAGATLFELQFTGTALDVEAELVLAAGCEIADGWAEPLQQVRLQAPILRDHRRMGLQASNYPNPFSGSTTLELSLPEAGEVQLRITDSRGRLVLQWPLQQFEAGNHRLQLPSESWQDGSYHCELLYSTAERSERKLLRLLKQK